MTSDTLTLWLSAGKPVAAVAVAQLWERGKLALDDRVARHIPEFAQRGKDRITLRHLLTHTGGFRSAIGNATHDSWEQIIDHICRAPVTPGWEIGRTAGYHAASSWFILGELVRRLDGRPFEQYVREAIFLPLGMDDSWVGISPGRYERYDQRLALVYSTERREPRLHNFWNTAEGRTACRPGANATGPIRQLGRFYEMMLAGGEYNGARILLPQTVEAMVARHRVGTMDETFKHVMDWGLGFMSNSWQYDEFPYNFGAFASERAFGHGGAQSCLAYADPEEQLVVAVVFNGLPGESQHHERMRHLLTALAADLGLSGT